MKPFIKVAVLRRNEKRGCGPSRILFNLQWEELLFESRPANRNLDTLRDGRLIEADILLICSC